MPRHAEAAAPDTTPAGLNFPQDTESTPPDLQSFIDTNCPNDNYICKVYQVRANVKGGHKTDRQLIDEYMDCFPSIRDLGTENGAGTYEYFIYIRRKGGGQELKTFRINLAARWDIIRDEFLQSRGINPATRPEGMQSTITMMKDMFSIITPLFQSQGQAAGNGGGQAAAVLNSMIEMQGKMLNQNFAAQMDMQNKVIGTLEENRKNLLSDDNGNGNDTALISEIMQTLKSFVPLLMVAPPRAAQAATSQAIQARPDVKSLVDNAGRRAALEGRIKSEFDPATAAKVLNVLSGVSGGNGRKPGQAMQRGQAQGSARPAQATSRPATAAQGKRKR